MEAYRYGCTIPDCEFETDVETRGESSIRHPCEDCNRPRMLQRIDEGDAEDSRTSRSLPSRRLTPKTDDGDSDESDDDGSLSSHAQRRKERFGIPRTHPAWTGGGVT